MLSFCRETTKNILLLVLGFTVFCILPSSGDVYADAVSASDLYKLSLAQGANNCYPGYFKEEIKSEDFKPGSSNTYLKTQISWLTYVPTKVGNSDWDGQLQCNSLFAGKSGAKGLFQLYKPEGLYNIGYVNGRYGTEKATKVTFKDVESRQNQDWSIDFKHFSLNIADDNVQANGFIKFKGVETNNKGVAKDNTFQGYVITFEDNGDIKSSGYFNWTYAYKKVYKAEGKDDYYRNFYVSIINAFAKTAIGVDDSFSCNANPSSDNDIAKCVYGIDAETKLEKFYNESESNKDKGSVDKSTTYNLKKDAEVKDMLNGIGFKLDTPNDKLKWNSDYTYGLYYNYLLNYGDKGITAGKCAKEKNSEYKYFFRGTKDTWCAIGFTADTTFEENDKVNIVSGDDLSRGTMGDVLNWLNNEDSYKGMSDDKYANFAETDMVSVGSLAKDGDDVEGEKDEFSEACSKQAQSLGWIICPVIKGLKNAVGGIYGMVEPMIRVSDGVLEQLKAGNSDGDGPTYKAWSFFRNIANVIFVILFLVIIFSQLTGYGIDNYGIKKMLPKIIVTAILVNLSFIICAVMIDISNVVGKAIQDLFMTMGEKVDNDIIAPGEGSSITGSVNSVVESVCGIVTVVGSGALAINGIGAVATGGFAIIIPVLLFLVSAVIAVLFALAILGIRQALVVVLIVVSPIVFACTLLPNTEKLFKNWKDLFVKILTVYPIVSALIGAGYFTAKILYTEENDLFMGIVAGTLLLGPYFAVPTLVKKSLAAAGNIGALLSSKGDMLRGRVKNYGNSEKIKDIRARSRANSLGTKSLNKLTMAADEKFNGKSGAAAWLARHTIASTGRLNAVADANKTRIEKGRDRARRNAYNSEFYGYNDDTKSWTDIITNGKLNGIDKNDFGALGNELENELQKGEHADSNKIRAIQDVMLTYGKKGGKIRLAEISKKYATDGFGENTANMSGAMKHFYDNLKNNHGSEIESFADLMEAAKVGATTGRLEDDKGNQLSYGKLLANSLNTMNSEKMSNMSKHTIEEIANSANYEKSDEAERVQADYRKYAEAAMQSDKLKHNINGDARTAMVDKLKAKDPQQN